MLQQVLSSSRLPSVSGNSRIASESIGAVDGSVSDMSIRPKKRRRLTSVDFSVVVNASSAVKTGIHLLHTVVCLQILVPV